ncbi:FkbM family methyltransferase [Methylomonas methanica]|uniref:Methyltransferase FkbM domain-containing protein n=1 Tax=Methylomonas methanica TaxID=421 RepID=A0A177MQH4_METMH|nr:FkbM family methyltransferase [Methylomonas methanica]OAI07543.1 hypothetical protein A1332_08650 [Methylomonas methanica]
MKIFLYKLGRFLIRLSGVPEKANTALLAWRLDDGDNTLRITYDSLCKDSVIFDLGAFKGQWASDIYSKYMCEIYCFEPSTKYNKFITDRFKNNKKIKIIKLALADNNGMAGLSSNEDASSLYSQETCEQIKLVKASEYISENEFTRINLMKINIEGAEYDLLEHLIEEGIVNIIENLQIQFHNMFDDSRIRMKNIQSKLSKTHRLTYKYEFVWENWEIKNSNQ